MAISIVFLLFGALVAYIPLRYALIYINTPVKDVPGPFLAQFTQLWYFYQSGTGNFHRLNVELHRRYGKFVRLTPTLVSINDTDSIKTIYGNNLRKGEYYDVSQEPDTDKRDLFGQRDVEAHKLFKRQIHGLYSDAALARMEDDVDVCIRQLEDHFDRFSREKTVFDFHHWMKCYAIDANGLITFNTQYGNLEKGEDPSGVIALWTGVFNYMAQVAVYPPLHRWLFRITSRLGENPFAPAFRFINQRIDDRLNEIDADKSLLHAPDFLTGLLRLFKQDPDAFPRYKVIQSISQNIAAGNDTLSAALTVIILHLSENPQILRKLREELDHTQLSDPPRYSEVRNLPYLHAVVQEGLRIFPPVGFPEVREVPAGGLTIAGRFFSDKTEVAMNPWVLNRNAEIFGDDVEAFRPERWLGDADSVQRMNAGFFSYGAGARSCIGKNIANMVLHRTVARLVQRFDFALAQPKEEIKEVFRVFVMFEKVNVTVRERQRAA